LTTKLDIVRVTVPPIFHMGYTKRSGARFGGATWACTGSVKIIRLKNVAITNRIIVTLFTGKMVTWTQRQDWLYLASQSFH
jgi:hypothetical protein